MQVENRESRIENCRESRIENRESKIENSRESRIENFRVGCGLINFRLFVDCGLWSNGFVVCALEGKLHFM